MFIEQICDFLDAIRLPFTFESIGRETFVPGIEIVAGALIVDRIRCHPGDILHEAGHLAVVPQRFRPFATGDIDAALGPHYDDWFRTAAPSIHPDDATSRAILQSGEAEAMAWSFAAAKAAGVAPEVVFHPTGYDGSEDVIAMLCTGHHYGVHGLHHGGMTTRQMFPDMIRWLQN